ncbi:MAG: CapA family protein [Actinobacteria bacterium]|nr:CapA family protein [Actinomycetota bacterium]MCB9388779.1 CapA family protein [Acidimicrobiia bacterium]
MLKGFGSVIGSVLVMSGVTALTVLPTSAPAGPSGGTDSNGTEMVVTAGADQPVDDSMGLQRSRTAPSTTVQRESQASDTSAASSQTTSALSVLRPFRSDSASEEPRGSTQTTRSATASPGNSDDVDALTGDGNDGREQSRSNLDEIDATTPRPSQDRSGAISFAVTGDVLIHSPVARAAATSSGGYDFVPMLGDVAPLISHAAIGICHMETPISRDNSDLSGYPVFSAPHEIAASLADTGYDGCSTASNHSIDQGFDGVTATLDALDEVGLAHAGTARSQEEALGVTTYVVNGRRVAHLSYTYGTNGIPIPAAEPWSVHLIDTDAIVRAAAEVRAAGADGVVVSLHWGQEYHVDPTDEQRRVAAILARSGDIDVIVGHHAHVVQPVEMIDNTLVIWGLGNLLSNQSAGCCTARSQDGVVISFNLVPDGERLRAADVEAHPTWVDRSARYRVVDIASSDGGSEVCASWDRTVETLRARSNIVSIPSSPCG